MALNTRSPGCMPVSLQLWSTITVGPSGAKYYTATYSVDNIAFEYCSRLHSVFESIRQKSQWKLIRLRPDFLIFGATDKSLLWLTYLLTYLLS